MIDFFAHLFLKNSEDIHDPDVRTGYGTICTSVAILFNVLLFAVKLIIGRAAHSVSITADAVNNLTDAGSSVLLFIGFRLANKKPDPEHPFGHGRLEYVAGFIVSALILVTGAELALDSVRKISAPDPIEFSFVLIGVLLLAIAAKIYMWAFTRRTAKKLDSAAMHATAADYLSDSISTAVVLLCMLIFRFTGLNLDAWGGLVVSGLILKTGIEAAADTLRQLLGTKGSEGLVCEVEKLVGQFPEIIGIHDMIIHDYGPGRLYISLHAEVDGSGNIYALHDAMDRAMDLLDKTLGCESVIHMDPVDTHDERLGILRDETAKLVLSIDPMLKMHDFRIVPGPTHTNLLFDVLTPYKFRMTDQALQQEISRRIQEKHPECFCVIKIDKAYI